MFLDRLWQDLRIRASPYEPLHNGDVDGPIKQSARWRQLLPRGRKGLTIVLVIAFVFIFALILKRPANLDIRNLRRPRPSTEATAGYLHILVPTGDANPSYCRTSLSASLLNYPPPFTPNWGGRFNDDKYGQDGRWEWGKLAGTLQYLKDLPEARADDLILIIDSEDTWFQLQPELLIKRYRETIRESNRRLQARLGDAAGDLVINDIVFAAQRKCPANSPDHISCYAAPEPPSPSSHYQYSATIPAENDRTEDDRPRFLNAGMMMGPLASVLQTYQVAYSRWERSPSAYTTRQALFADLFGEQEYQREVLRIDSLSFVSRIKGYLFGSSTFLHGRKPPQSVLEATNDTSPEQSITLDYTSLLSHVAEDDETDSSYIRFSDKPSLTSSALNITWSLPRKQIARDIEYARPPFFSLAPFSSAYPFEYEDLPKEITWENMPLLTNLHTSNSPPLIIHSKASPANAKPDDDEKPTEEDILSRWKHLWFHPHLRMKLQNHAYEPVYAIASEHFPAHPHPHQYVLSNPTYAPTNPKSAVTKNWWSPVYVSPINKDRPGVGWLVDADYSKGKDGWALWAEKCDDELQGRLMGDEKGKWVDLSPYPPFADLEGGQGSSID